MNRRTSAALALLLLALLGVLLWPRDTDRAHDNDQGKRSSLDQNTRWSSGSSQLPSKLPRHTLHRHGPHATHTPEELKNFIIPELTAEDATVEEALATLFAQYNEICTNTGETPLKFTYRIKTTPSSTLDLDLQQVSFLRALRIIAARSGLVLERDGTQLVFSPREFEPAESLVTARHPVPPTFVSDLDTWFSNAPGPAPDDPFSGNPASGDLLIKPAPLIDQLRNLGIIRSSNAAVSFLPGSSTLVIKASPADRSRLQAFLNDELLNNRPVQLKTTTKFIESTTPLTFEKTSFSDEEFQVLMRSIPQTKGVDIITQPSVVSRPGQTGTIQIGREVVIPDPDNAGKFQQDWTGIKTQVNSGGYGFDLQSNITNETREAMDDSPDSIKGVTTDTSQHHPSGHTVLIESTSPDGSPLYIFSTTQRVDATGRPYDPRNPDQ